MSVLFSLDNCSLISHEEYINRVYSECVSTDEGTETRYKINPDLFNLNVPYRFKNIDCQTKKRQRKIIDKTKQQVAEQHRDEYELVISVFFLFLWNFTRIILFSDRKNETKNKRILG